MTLPSPPPPTLQIIYPSSPTYTRLLTRNFNTLPLNRQPPAICQPRTVSDLQSAIRLSIQHNWRVSVRSGGHSWACWGVRDDALLVDLGQMREMEMVPEAEMARMGMVGREGEVVAVSPAVTGKELNDFLARQGEGRMFPGGHCPDVGLGGFLLQGGMGWNAKGWGWGCSYVLAADVVTATGEALHCSTTSHSDLFWAIRGAGPGCPVIVSKFYLQSRPAYPAMYSATYIYPVSEFKAVMDWVVQISPTFDPDTEIVLLSAYPPHDPTATSPSLIVIFTTFKATRSAASAALTPTQLSRPPNFLAEIPFEATSFDKEYAAQTCASPAGYRYAADNAHLRNDCDVAAVLEKPFTSLPSRESYALYFSMAPTSQKPLENMALSLQSDHYVALYATWKSEDDDERCKEWLRGVMRGVAKESVGSYLGDADFRVRKTRFWAVEQGRKLMHVREKWDVGGRICGFLGAERVDGDGREELENRLEWETNLG